MIEQKEFKKMLMDMSNAWWNGAMSNQMKSYLSNKTLDEAQLRLLLEHTFIEGVRVGIVIQQSVINESLNQKGSQSIEDVRGKEE